MSKTSIKSRFFCLLLALSVAICTIPSITVSAYNSFDGGYDSIYISTTVTVNGNSYGLGRGEGVTVLSKSGNQALIEFNTYDGPMQTWVNQNILYHSGNCALTGSVYGYVNTTSNTYYSPDWNFYAGAIYAGENVAVLAYSEGWAYIEYNVSNAMRKRAYTPAGNITFSYASNTSASSNSNNSRPHDYFYQNDTRGLMITVNSTTTVYSGPNGSTYATIGTIYTSDNGSIHVYADFLDGDYDRMFYVSYPVGNSTKFGYIYGDDSMLYN